MLFYATPVIYAGHVVPEPFDKVTWLNPMTGILEMMRAGFFSHEGRQAIVWGAVWSSLAITVLAVLVGTAAFGRLERAVLKEI